LKLYREVCALLEQVHLLRQAWCEHKENKLIVTKYVQNVHLLDKCVCVYMAYVPDFEPVLPQQKSQLHDVRGLLLLIDDQANQFLAKFSTIFFIFLLFQFL